MSATVETSNEEVIRHIMKICKRDPREGKVTTGGIVTVKDSTENWYLSWTINRQPQFKSQDNRRFGKECLQHNNVLYALHQRILPAEEE